MYRSLLLVLVLAFTTPAAAQSVDALIARGDSADAAMNPSAALHYYRQAAKRDAGDPDVLWRIAKVYSGLAAGEKDADRARRHLQTSMIYARRAVEADSTNAMAQVTLAVAYGQQAEIAPSSEKLELSKLLRNHARIALDLDPGNYSAMLVLGIWHRELASLSWVLKLTLKVVYGGLPEASLEESRRLLSRAVAIKPDVIMTRVELAKTLIELDESEEARRQLRRALTLPKRDAGDGSRLDEARLLLQDLT